MRLIQLLLPLFAETGRKISEKEFARVRDELTQRYGGVTAYSHAPATGLWKRASGKIDRDTMILVEVIVKHFDRAEWRVYRKELEKRFAQKRLLARASHIEII